MRKILIITIIALFFLPLIRAETGGCLSNLRIELATYETDTHNETIILEKSVHQPNDAQGFAKQGDILYVEKLTANVNATCLQNNDNKREEVNIQFKRPYEDVWGEDIPILLQITDSKINFYWMKLRDANFGRQARYEDSIGWKDIAIPAIKLDEEGVWDVRVIYDSAEKHDLLTNYKSGDSDIIIPGRIEVEPRVSISILDTNKQILKDSDESSRTSIKIAIESTILAFIVGFAGILSTIFLTKKQLDKMDLLHMQQIEKQDKIEKDKQYGILDGLKHNIDIIKDNLVGHKKEFKL